MNKSSTHLVPRIKLAFSALVSAGTMLPALAISALAIPALAILVYTPSAYTQNYDPSSSVFRFHQKMAKRGVAASQQKLGLMYETGSGTRQSTLSSRLWYKKAAAQNYKPAINRLTYLQIKQSGYTNEHDKWLKNLKNDASFNDGEALFLLGQMYSEGTGVNKSLTKSLELLKKAAAGDIPGSEAQVTKVEEELSTLRAQHARQKKAETTRLKPLKASPANKTPAKPAPRTARLAITRVTAPATHKVPPKTSQTAQQKVSSKSQNRQDEDTTRTSTAASKKTARNKTLTNPATEGPEQTHPMDAICGGRNRFNRGCRQY